MLHFTIFQHKCLLSLSVGSIVITCHIMKKSIINHMATRGINGDSGDRPVGCRGRQRHGKPILVPGTRSYHSVALFVPKQQLKEASITNCYFLHFHYLHREFEIAMQTQWQGSGTRERGWVSLCCGTKSNIRNPFFLTLVRTRGLGRY